MENVEESKDIEVASSDSEIEKVEKGKPKRERKPYVLTEARKAQFEKARLKRAENVKLKKDAVAVTKKQAEEKLQVYDEIKKDLQVKKERQQRKKKTQEIKQIMQEMSSDESSDNDEQAEQALRALLARRASKRQSLENTIVAKELPPQRTPTISGVVQKLPASGMSMFRYC